MILYDQNTFGSKIVKIIRDMKLSLKSACRAHLFVHFGPV